MSRTLRLLIGLALFTLSALDPALAQEARSRWERMAQIRRDKFDHVLPDAMRENGIDMWITVVREGLHDPLFEDLGRGYVGNIGYYIFTDRGSDRIERAALGIEGYLLERNGAYDFIGSADLRQFVAERDPKRIGVNMSRSIGAADGLSHSSFEHLVEILGQPYATRMVSAERLISAFRSRRVATEIVAFAEAGELSRQIAERALSNEVIVPGVTALEDVAWWMMDELLSRGLDTSFDFPSVYITGPEGILATSSERIIQRGDLLMIDWGVGYLNLYTDMKRIGYVLRAGETAVPAGIQNAFEQGLRVREIIRKTISAGPTAGGDARSSEHRDRRRRFRDHEAVQRRLGRADDRGDDRLPFGGQPGARNRPLDRRLQPAADDLRDQAEQPVLDRAVRLDRGSGMGWGQGANPARG